MELRTYGRSLGAVAVLGAIALGSWGCGSDDATSPAAPEKAAGALSPAEHRPDRDHTSVTFPGATAPTLPCNQPSCLSPGPRASSATPR